MSRQTIQSLTLPELTEAVTRMGEKPFRAKQLYEWLHVKLADDVSQMTNLPAAFRARLAEEYELQPVRMAESFLSELDGTRKFLFQLADGSVIESVLMKYHYGNSVCISSQVGCRMGCRFCASTLGGLERNLDAGEMLGQVYQIQKISGERVSHVVVMGSGEPLDNYDAFVRFVRMVSDERGLHLSQRNITASTCGLVEQIRRLAQEKLQITLAISLHAPNDEKRRLLMPVANRYRIEEIIAACREYEEITGRRITFEYSLVKGQNDGVQDAKELASVLSGLNCHVNLIPVNPIKERDYEATEGPDAERFKNLLEKNHINATIRRKLGADIGAACGQLRKSYLERTKEVSS